MTYIEVVTFGIALVGATLGILNFLIERSRTRVRLRVVPKLSYLMKRGFDGEETWLSSTVPDSRFQAKIGAESLPFRWSIEVVNLSEFPVSISQVGFGSPRGGPDGQRCFIVAPATSSGSNLPVRLESRQAETFHSMINQPLHGLAIANPIAWAQTECGVTSTGTSAMLKSQASKLARTVRADHQSQD